MDNDDWKKAGVLLVGNCERLEVDLGIGSVTDTFDRYSSKG